MQPDDKTARDRSEEDRLRAWRETRRASKPAPRPSEGHSQAPSQTSGQTSGPTSGQASGSAPAPETPEMSDSARQEAERVRNWRQNRTRPPTPIKPKTPEPPAPEAAVSKPVSAPVPGPGSGAPLGPQVRAPRPPEPTPDPTPTPQASPATPAEAPAHKVDPIEEQRRRLRRVLAAGRRKFWLSVAVFALLPALLAVAYETYVAVPLYEAQSVIMVAKASNVGDASAGSFLGALGAGGGGSNISEAFMAQEYVHSQALLEDLERDLGVLTRFSSEEIDPLRRLRTLDFFGISQRSQFQRYVRSSVNVQTGMMTLIVRAPSVEEVVAISEAILTRIERRVNDLSEGLFAQQIEQARLTVAEARQYLIDTQAALTALQIESGEADLQIRVVGVYEAISAVEDELLQIETQIAEQDVSGRAESFETERLDALRSSLEARVALMRQRLLQSPSGSDQRPLSELLLDYQRLQLEREIGLEALSLALVAQEQAQEMAALGRSQFQVVVPPVAAEIPWRPRPLYAGLVVFLFAISALSLARLFRGR
jgi:capsular polysaccharide transport system permease protein